jgi:ABC-type antimicrobial peptide transport system permease subunit
MDPAVEQALINLVQAGNVRPLLTYLVHAISSPGSTTVTPNSMVTATEGIVPDPPPGSTLPPAAIIQWLADDLGIGIGDTVSLRYLVPATGSQRKLAEKSAEFVVTRILPMTANEVDDSWMPAFPGITDADNCRDWDPGFEIDLGAIREKDEAYWRTHRGTPKVFLQLDDGTRLWRNRYGKSTGIRFSRPPEDLTGALRERITPAAVGISVETLRQDADAAVRDALPLGTYFLYFGWFILVAAVMLAALLFLFALESRSAQLGLQKAVGLPESITRIAVLGEAALVTLLGSLCGIGLGTVYARACLWGLTHLWQDATGAIPWVFHLQPLTALGGALLAVLFSLAVVTFAGRGLFRKSPRQLLSGAEAAAFSRDHAISTQSSRCRVSAAAISAMLALAGAAGALLISRNLSGPPLAGAFFGAGALLLVAGISVLAMILRHLDRPREAAPGSIVQLGIRNLVRRPGRALTVTGLVASAVFLVASVNAFRLDASSDASFRSSGTGGFALVGESSLPIYHDPGSAAGQLALGFDPGELDGVAIVPLRSLPGDDASCLNLNRAQRPTLLGIDPSELATRQAFTFTSGEQNWASLNGLTEAGNIPAIVDQNTANYALGKKIGDCLVYTDEQGEQFNIEIVGTLAGSILQGRVILCAEHFTRHFPSAAGYHSFLVDIGPGAGDQNAIASLLARQLASRGLALQSAADRLDEFHAVQNSYLGIFTALGGLGVVIGTLGLGAVVARQLLERRGELSLMRALGFTATRIRLLILSEHIALLVFSITLGLATAFIAIWPQLASPGSGINLSGIFLFSALSLLLGVASIAAASVRLPDLRTSLQSE